LERKDERGGSGDMICRIIVYMPFIELGNGYNVSKYVYEQIA
jgi:hypothetical protein